MPFSATRDLWLVLKARDEASRAMGAFSRDIRMVGDSVRVANLQAAKSALQNHMAIQRMTGASQADILTTQRRIQQVDQEINQSRVYRAAMEEQRVASQRLASSLQGIAGAATAVGTGLTAAGVFGLMGLKSLVNASVEYERQSQLTATQVDKFAISLQDIEKIGLRVAAAVGVPFEQIQPALFDIFSSMEIGAADAEKLLTIFSKAAVAGQTNIQNASKATIGILNAFQLPLSSINHLMDVQFLLVKEGIGSYEEWTSRIGLVTPSAVRFGQSVDVMTAALAASTRMGITAARSATAVSRAMDAMSNPKAVDALKKMGVNALDAQGNFRNMIDILFDFRKALDKIPGQEQKIAAILDVFKGAGGTVEARRFLQNMLITPGNLELFQQIFKQMGDSAGTFEQAYSMMADTTATKTQLVANKWETLKVAAGTALAPTFLKVLDIVGKVLDKFNNLSPATQATIMKILALAAAGSVVLGILLLLVGTVAAFAAAIAVAGSVVFVVAGAIAAFTVGLVALAVILVEAWKKSQPFRDIIMEIADLVTHLWKDIIVPFAKDVANAFETKLLPPLEHLYDVFSTKIMPIIKEVIDKWKNDWLPLIKDISDWVKNHLADAFSVIGNVITTMVIPAIERINKFYEEHKKTINEIIKVLAIASAVFIGLAIAVGVILAAAFGGPIVAIIVGLIAAFSAVIFIVVKVIEIVKNIIRWFSDFGSHMDWLGGKIKGIWDAIAGFFEAGINKVRDMWKKFWQTDIGQFLLAIWNVITGIIDVALALIQVEFHAFIQGITDTWNAVWDAVAGKVMAVWNFIEPFLSTAWKAISDFAVKNWNAFKDFIAQVWDDISGVIGSKIHGVVNVVGKAWGDIKQGAIDEFNAIKDFFRDADKWLFDSGKKLVQGLLDGMTDKLNDLGDGLHKLAQRIRDFFPHSPAKLGPLAGKGGMFFAGQNLVNQLQDGINSRMAMVNYSSTLLANAAGSAVTNAGGTGVGGQFNQNITVNTQEINPKRHAMELGMLLAGSKG